MSQLRHGAVGVIILTLLVCYVVRYVIPDLLAAEAYVKKHLKRFDVCVYCPRICVNAVNIRDFLFFLRDCKRLVA